MNETEREAVHCLWDQVADFPVSRTDEALVFLMEGVCRLIDAGDAFWFGSLRLIPTSEEEELRGWRPRAIRYLRPTPLHEQIYREQTARMTRGEMNSSYSLAVRHAGTFRSFRIRRELPAAWFKGTFYKIFLASRGYHDSCYVVFPMHDDCESYFAFHRVGSKKNFTSEEEAIAAYALRGIKWFHRQILLSHGAFLAEGPLSPIQRQIVGLLLTGHSEKEVSGHLSQSSHTVHKHVTEIFRKFGVNSRAALMALWLGQKR